MFFHFIKVVIIYLLIRLIFIQTFQMIAFSNSHYVSTSKQNSFHGLAALEFYPAKRFLEAELIEIQVFVKLVYTFVMIAFFLVYRFIHRHHDNLLHCDVYDQSDFTVMVENIPFFAFLQAQPMKYSETLPAYYDLLHLTENDVNLSEVVNTDNPNIIISESLKLFFNRQINKWRDRVDRQGYDNIDKLKPFERSFYEKVKNVP